MGIEYNSNFTVGQSLFGKDVCFTHLDISSSERILSHHKTISPAKTKRTLNIWPLAVGSLSQVATKRCPNDGAGRKLSGGGVMDTGVSILAKAD